MKIDIILSGVGGQGILSIAAIIGYAALEEGLYMKQSEVHGMSQRGGAVMSNLRISDKPIASDLIPFGKADVIISVEPMESLRYLKYLSPEGWLITSMEPFNNINNYPSIDDLKKDIDSVKHHVRLNAEEIAKNIKSRRSSNIVMLGAASPFIGIKYETIIAGIKTIFGSKGEDIVNKNIEALELGIAEAKKFM